MVATESNFMVDDNTGDYEKLSRSRMNLGSHLIADCVHKVGTETADVFST